MSFAKPEKMEGSPVSLHQRILGEIEARILSGEWPPGYRIPFEHELTQQFGCSRMTVSKVLTQLANAGLIERRRKAGSFVRRPHSQAAVLEIQDIQAEVSARDLPYRFEIVSRRKRRSIAADRAEIDVLPRDQVLDLTCRHFAGDQPFCVEQRLINLTVAPEAEREDFGEMPPGTWLIHQVPWSAAEHKIKATAAGAAMASMLDIPEDSACLVIERRTWTSDRPVTFVRLTYPGDAHELVARFAPSQG